MDREAESQEHCDQAREDRWQHVTAWIACALTMPLAVGAYAHVFLGSWSQEVLLCAVPERSMTAKELLIAVLGAVSLGVFVRFRCGPRVRSRPFGHSRGRARSAALAFCIIWFASIVVAIHLLSCLTIAHE